MARITLNVTLYQSYILSHYSRQSISLSSSFRGLGRFPSMHRVCTSFWSVFSSSSSETVRTSLEREETFQHELVGRANKQRVNSSECLQNFIFKRQLRLDVLSTFNIFLLYSIHEVFYIGMVFPQLFDNFVDLGRIPEPNSCSYCFIISIN